MKRFLTLFKIEGKLALRCPDGIIFGVIMPVGILFLIGFIAKDQQAGNSGYTFMQSAFSSLITIGICATAFMGLPKMCIRDSFHIITSKFSPFIIQRKQNEHNKLRLYL